ncbi:hypothetical protein C6501_04270 [Candidatus Poribacteria bacterium]|nr:MAG: hypothetical protein C6501_04270 [Candidatus Poribacteria bacterium]
MAHVTLLDPTSQGDAAEKFLAPRLDTFDRKVMGLLDITKNGSDIFLDRVEELMRAQFDIAEVIRVKKPTFARPAPIALLVDLADQTDFVIEGLAD